MTDTFVTPVTFQRQPLYVRVIVCPADKSSRGFLKVPVVRPTAVFYELP